MTAVEWLIEQLMERGFQEKNYKIIEQAKEMEKQQIQYFGARCCLMTKQKNQWTLEGLYNDLYGSKGSDETLKENHIADTTEMVSSQTEISDEEIREQGIKYDNQALSETPIAHFMEGAFWYREQLKKKQ